MPEALRAGVRKAVLRIPAARRLALTARFGDLGRTQPLTEWGLERGTAVDRWYIERYLQGQQHLVTGRVLEVKLDQYASRLGAASVEVIDIDADNPHATLVGDLCDPSTLAPGSYDTAVVTQTLHLLHDPGTAVRGLLASLRAGGSLLLTVPCMSRRCGPGDLWRWTPEGLERLLRDCAPAQAAVEVAGLGNNLAGRAFLFGLAAEDLEPAALAVDDPELPLVVGATVRLPG